MANHGSHITAFNDPFKSMQGLQGPILIRDMEKTTGEQPKAVFHLFHNDRIVPGQTWLLCYTNFPAFLVVRFGQVTKLWPTNYA